MVRWIEKPSRSNPGGSTNVCWELLDRPVALGHADDPVPIDVDDPITMAELLDRVARVAAVLTMGGPAAEGTLRVDHAGLSPVQSAIVELAALRIGARIGAVTADAEPDVLVRPEAATTQAAPAMPGAAERTRRIRSHVDGLELVAGETILPLGALVRDARLEPAAVVPVMALAPLYGMEHEFSGLTTLGLLDDEEPSGDTPLWFSALRSVSETDPR